jgi:FkbM family methyltransferase
LRLATWPLRLYVRRAPWTRGKGFVQWRLLRPLLPPLPATFVMTIPMLDEPELELAYRDLVGLDALIHGDLEPAEARVLCERAAPRTCAIDVGAHAGYFTLVLAAAVGPGGRVLAFEPYEPAVALLRANLARNTVTNVDVYASAAGAHDGFVDLAVNDKDAMLTSRADGCGRRVRVPCVRLDAAWREAGAPPVSALKVDVEGAELSVLRGGPEVIQRCRPPILLEANTPEELAPLVAELEPLGYRRSTPPGFAPRNHLFEAQPPYTRP